MITTTITNTINITIHIAIAIACDRAIGITSIIPMVIISISPRASSLKYAVVGNPLPPVQSPSYPWVRGRVGIIVALHHAIDKVDNSWQDCI